MPVHGTHNAVQDDRNDHVWIYVNGELFPRHEAKISVFDSGYLVGDGVWEALRLHNDVLVFLDEHLDRLWQGAATIGMKMQLTRAELTAAIWQTLRANDMHDNVHVRLMITRGIKKTPSQDPRLTISKPTIVIIAEHKQANPAVFERGVILELAAAFPDLAPQLQALAGRLFDLLPFTREHYYHPAMMGSWSIKAVLPTIAPDLDYANLDDVQSGEMVEPVYFEMIDPATSAERRAALERALLVYCERDTLAMVRLAEFLGSQSS